MLRLFCAIAAIELHIIVRHTSRFQHNETNRTTHPAPGCAIAEAIMTNGRGLQRA